MNRKLFALIVALCLSFVCILSVQAASARLVDNAALLTADEAEQVERALDEVSQRHGMDVVVVTVDSLGGKTPGVYADDYYDNNGYGADGILLLVSMEERDWWISTVGYGITAFTDAGIEYIADRVVPELGSGDYAWAFTVFAELCDDFITQAKTDQPYNVGNLPQEPFPAVLMLMICLATGLVVALIATGIMKGKLKTVRMQSRADDYVTPGSMRLIHSRDLFLYAHVEKREKPKSNTGGGSTTHVSSSGTTHGGGGGKF